MRGLDSAQANEVPVRSPLPKQDKRPPALGKSAWPFFRVINVDETVRHQHRDDYL